jgi:hypothetical protein
VSAPLVSIIIPVLDDIDALERLLPTLDPNSDIETAAELATGTGRERLAACVFRVPIGQEMVPMCRVNASGIRDTVYARRSLVNESREPATLARSVPSTHPV